MHVHVARPARAGELDDQLRSERRRPGCEVRIDALLPAIRSLGAQTETLRRAEDGVRLEVRGLQEDVGGRLRDLGLLAAHDSREGDRTLCVGDHQIGRIELAELAVERAQLLTLVRAANDDSFVLQRREIERMQWIAEREHCVVRDVDDVRDRPHPRVRETCPQPGGRRSDLHVAEQAPDVARAPFEVLDAGVDAFVAGHAWIASGRSGECGAVQRGDLPRDAVDRHQIWTVARGLDEEDVLGERQSVGERGPRGPLVGQNHDSAVIRAELDLVLGEDHPVRPLSA